jgi:hypothetical protein
MHIPELIGWTPTVLSLLFLAMAAARWDRSLRIAEVLLLIGWGFAGYVFFTLVAHKETRYEIFILWPLILFSTLALFRILGQRVGTLVSLALALFYLGQAAHAAIPEYHGYKEAAAFIAREAPRNSVVLYFGDHDNALIFNVRREGRRDLVILRGDKLLLRYSMLRSRGMSERITNEAVISDVLNKDGVELAILQEGFWTDLEAIRSLGNVLHSSQFAFVTEFGATSNVGPSQGKLTVFKNLGDFAKGPIHFDIELLTIGRTLSGTSQ